MRFFPRQLYAQLVLMVTVIIVAAFLSFGIMNTENQAAILEGIIRTESAAVTRNIAESCVHHLVVWDYAGLDELLIRFAQLPDIVSLQATEPDGTVLSTVNGKASAAGRQTPVKTTVPAETAMRIDIENGNLVVWHPVIAGRPLGWIKATFSLHDLALLKASIWRNSFLLAVLWIAISAGLILILMRRPARAVQRLSRFARDLNLRKGSTVDVPASSSEIEELGEALNRASVELHGSERALLDERERLAVTLESIGHGLIVIDRDFRILSANRAYAEQVNKPITEIIGKTCYSVSHLSPVPCGQGQGACSCPAGQTFAAGEPATAVHDHGLPGRPLVHVEVRTFPIRDAGGKVISVIETLTDITERRKLEDQLRQAQKMEAVGQLAGGVAHDFNNVLTAITGYGNLVLRKTGDNADLHHYAEQILASAERAAKLTGSLLTFSRKQVFEMKPVDLNDVVKGVDKLLRRLIGEDVELRTTLTGSDLVVMADSGQIGQVLMNLVTNARDAMPHGGILTLETGDLEVDEKSRLEHGFERTGRYTCIAVSDTGIGMSEETRSRIFDPFFTTKEVGKGTGLGLAIAYGIVKQHGGSITVYSEPGKGTTFRIYIPVIQAAKEAKAKPESTPVMIGGTETVLLAEDEQAVRDLMKLVLESVGYRVIEAADGESAIARFKEHADKIQLLITDVIMPGKNGREVFDAVRAMRPETKALFMSGYTADIIQARGIVDQGVNFISKPIAPDVLLTKVRGILDER